MNIAETIFHPKCDELKIRIYFGTKKDEIFKPLLNSGVLKKMNIQKVFFFDINEDYYTSQNECREEAIKRLERIYKACLQQGIEPKDYKSLVF